MLSVFLRGLTATVDLLFAPLAWWPPLVGLTVVALATACLALLVIKRTSNQARLRAAKNGMYAALLEMRLFNDDLGAILRAQLDVFRFNGRYLRASLVPVLWLIVPFGLLLAQLEAFYAYDGLTPHAPTLVTAHVKAGQALAAQSASLEVPTGIRTDTPAVWFPATSDLVWRIVPDSASEALVVIHTGSQALAKTVVVSGGVARRSPVRPSATWRAELADPSEAPLPVESPFDRVSVAYPARALTIAGWATPWWGVYGALTLVFGLALSRLFRVEI